MSRGGRRRQGALPWVPITEGKRAERTWALLRSLGAELESFTALQLDAFNTDVRAGVHGVGAAKGIAGIALSLAYLSQAGCARLSSAVELINTAVDRFDRGSPVLGLHEGWLGLAWVASHVAKRFLARIPQDWSAELDALYLSIMGRSGARHDSSLSCGICGVGVYALDRLRHPGEELASLVVGHLERSATDTSEGIYWVAPSSALPPNQLAAHPDGYFDRGYVDLGVANGLAGVIGFLARLQNAGVRSSAADRLLDGAVSWLLGQSLSGGQRNVFPAFIVHGQPCVLTDLPGWCYGDLGIAACLHEAGQATRNDKLVRKAVALATSVAARLQTGAHITNTGLCHGWAGTAHILNRFYQATRDPTFKSTAVFCLDRALAMRCHGLGVAGFRGIAVRQAPFWKYAPTFLYGAAGIALVLLSAASSLEPAWDRLLLLDLARRSKSDGLVVGTGSVADVTN